jgi:hypothetical protein
VAGLAWPHVLGGAWLAGSLAWYALAARRLWRFARGLRHARLAPADIQARVSVLAHRLGLRRVPGVWLVPGRLAPMLWCAGGAPRLLVPVGLLEELGQPGGDTVLLHELAHLRRRDHWVRLLEFVVLGLYWWHPVVWLARRELREAEEQCCDAWVVNALPGTGRAYATALLDTLDFLSPAPPAAPLLGCGIGRVTDLKRRLTMIMRGTTPRALTWPGVLAVFSLGALLLPMLPDWGRAQDEEKDPEGVRAKAREIRAKAREERARARETARGRGAELAQAQADLAKLEADLKKKLAEVQAARVKLAAAAKAAPGARREAGVVIRIEISGLGGKPEEVKALVEKLEKALGGDKRRVIIMQARTASGTLFGAPGGIRGRGPDPKAPAGSRPPVPRLPGLPGTPPTPPAGRDRRIEGMEKKLDSLLKELEALRKDLRGGRGGRRGDGGPGAPGVRRPGAGETRDLPAKR